MILKDLENMIYGDTKVVDICSRDNKKQPFNYQTMKTYENYHVIKIEVELESKTGTFDNSMRINPVVIIYVIENN